MAGRCFGLVLVSLVCFGAASGAETEKYVIEAPDVLRIMADAPATNGELFDKECLVRPDGTVGLGVYGNVKVAGLTVGQAKGAIAEHLASYAKSGDKVRVLVVDVAASNSKVCYLIVPRKEGIPGREGDQVCRFPIPIDGRATVASAVLEFEGLAAEATKGGVWVTRPAGKALAVFEVDWQAITGAGRLASNHKLEPGDRVWVGSAPPK